MKFLNSSKAANSDNPRKFRGKNPTKESPKHNSRERDTRQGKSAARHNNNGTKQQAKRNDGNQVKTHEQQQRAQPHARPPANTHNARRPRPNRKLFASSSVKENVFPWPVEEGPTRSWRTTQTLRRAGNSTRMCVDTVKIAASALSSLFSTF